MTTGKADADVVHHLEMTTEKSDADVGYHPERSVGTGTDDSADFTVINDQADSDLAARIAAFANSLEVDTIKAKTKKPVKRRVGQASKTIKQMKDTTVIQVAVGAITSISNLQAMTMYDTETKARKNPESSTFLLTYDEIVQSPREGGEGEREREVPVWNVLAPKGYTKDDLGTKLVALGHALKNEVARGKKRDAAVIEWTHDARDYLGSIYGNESGDVLNKKKRYTKRQATSDEEVL
jgi:hypothetical protein